MVDGDWSVDRATGNIRYIGGDHDNSPTYATVIQFHRWLQDKADDASSVGNDEIDITDLDPSARSTDNIINLLASYNIDKNASEHLYDGSIIQGTGGTERIFDGIVNFGTIGISIQIQQNGAVIADDFWNSNSGLNPDSTQGISHRFMVEVKTGGADIDGRRLLGTTRVFGKTFSEFPINGTSRGNNVLALSNADDLNNATAAATIEGYTAISNTNEGYIGIDANENGVNEFYYSAFDLDLPTRVINDFHERAKWFTQEAWIPTGWDSAASGADFLIGNGSFLGQAQAFNVGNNSLSLTKAAFRMKKTLLPVGNMVAKIYASTGTFGTSAAPTGSALATSDTFDSSTLDATYRDIFFDFTGTNLLELTASTEYVLAIEFTNTGTGSVSIQGQATSIHEGNQSDSTNLTAWTASATDDLYMNIYATSQMYELPGDFFRGITHQVPISGTNSGTFQAVEELSWGTGATAGKGQMVAIDNTSAASTAKVWMQLSSGVVPGTGVLLTGAQSAATCTTSGAVTERTIVSPFHGQSTGSAIIGSYGLGIEQPTTNLTTNDTLTDLDAATITPPNNVTFTVSGLVAGEDRVLVAPWDGSAVDAENNPAVDKAQLSLSTTLNTATETSIVLTTAIPSDTPATGDIRVGLDTAKYVEQPYSSYVTGGTTFTVPSSSYLAASNLDATAGNNVWISYLDKLATKYTLTTALSGAETAVVVSPAIGGTVAASGTLTIASDAGGTTDIAYSSQTGNTFTISGSIAASAIGNAVYTDTVETTTESFTGVFNAQRDFVVIVRDGGATPIKQFISSAKLSSTGGSITAIRTTDA